MAAGSLVLGNSILEICPHRGSFEEQGAEIINLTALIQCHLCPQNDELGLMEHLW